MRTPRPAIIDRVTSLLLLLAGLGAIVIGWLLVGRLGARARVGRILAATPIVPVDEAIRLAQGGSPRYVGVGGRVDSDREFLDEHARPLVLRRSRLELRTGSRWQVVADVRDVVPFEIAGGLASIGVDGGALDEGLVVVMRESEGTAGEIPDRVPQGTPASTPARLHVELLSTVDHALALGVPTLDEAGHPILRPGLGRPLVLTTLEPAEAMRMLAAAHWTSTRAGAVLMGGGVVTALVGVVWAADRRGGLTCRPTRAVIPGRCAGSGSAPASPSRLPGWRAPRASSRRPQPPRRAPSATREAAVRGLASSAIHSPLLSSWRSWQS